MVQMGDSVAVERCVQHLNNIPVGSNGKIQIAYDETSNECIDIAPNNEKTIAGSLNRISYQK